MKKTISLYSILLFIIPLLTLIICHQLHVSHTGVYTIPFIDGQVSISLIGRQKYSIGIFKPSFLIYMIISIFFYFKISKFFLLHEKKNKLHIYGISANLFLCFYIVALGKSGENYELMRRLSIISYIINMYINHIYLLKILKKLKLEKKVDFDTVYLFIFYVIIIIMTILAIIGLPWVNPLFKYPDQLKNIIEWNFFLLTIIFYIPLSLIFYNFNKQVNNEKTVT